MIISHKYKFIFIKIRKTASSSIEASLAPHCGENDVITPMPLSPEHNHARNWEGVVGGWRILQRIPELIFWRDTTIQNYKGMSQRRQILHGNLYNHMRAVDIKACIPAKIWNNYFKFCCERNPWDKLLSRYAWQYKGHDSELPNGVSSHLFTSYLQQNFKASPPLSDYAFYTDNSNKLLVDKVMRFEDLTNDFATVSNNIGIPAKLELQLKHGHRSPELSNKFAYRNIYTSEQRQLVEEACAKEIKLFGYEF